MECVESWELTRNSTRFTCLGKKLHIAFLNVIVDAVVEISQMKTNSRESIRLREHWK